MAKTIRQKAWDAFSKYIRLRDAIKTTGTTHEARCITCNRVYPIKGRGTMQAGHFQGGRSNAILIDEQGVHAQCYGCNVGKKGNTVPYYKFMLKEYGQEVIDDIEKRSGQIKQMKKYQWQEVIDTYKAKHKELLDKHC